MTVAARIRIVLRLLLLGSWLIACLIAYAIAKPFTRHNPVPPRFLGGTARLAGVRVQVEGQPLRRDALLLANHISWIDILVLAGASGTTFVAKAELAQSTLIGWLASLNETVFVQREARLAIGGQVDSVRQALATRRPVTLFPEGTTGPGSRLLPFKTAMLQVLDPAPRSIQVQPVVLDYGHATSDIAWVGEEGGLDNALRVLARSGRIPLTIRFLDPFTPDPSLTRKCIAAEVRRRMETVLHGG
nr:lysophospholipid acyltransferase family protein [Porphyrobacter sp. GA68]